MRKSAITASVFISMFAGNVQAQDLSSTISCLKGAVPPVDYSELGQKLRESLWDRKGGVSLNSNIGGVKLSVVDSYGGSVCQETANTSTSCTFRLDIAALEEFTIIVDNTENVRTSYFTICAY